MRETEPGQRLLPHPDADWYDREIGTTGGHLASPDSPVFWATPEERRSYARFLLAGHGGERSWELRELADWEPAALAPWADHVVDFDDAALERLGEIEWLDYWRASIGASDAAVDRLAARVAAARPTEPRHYQSSGTLAQARVDLLIGVDSDHALRRLAELAREHEIIDDMCGMRGVWVPRSGAAIRRYVPRPQEIVVTEGEPDPHLRVFPPAEQILVDPRGLGCPVRLQVPLEIDLLVLHGFPLQGFPLPGTPGAGSSEFGAPHRSHHFIASYCEDCEADEELRNHRGWRVVTDGPSRGKLAFDEERDETCEGNGDGDPGIETPALALSPGTRYDRENRARTVGQLGGWPHWAQYPEWEHCCDRPMFFVGELDLFGFGGVGAHLYGFQCECGAGAQVSHIT